MSGQNWCWKVKHQIFGDKSCRGLYPRCPTHVKSYQLCLIYCPISRLAYQETGPSVGTYWTQIYERETPNQSQATCLYFHNPNTSMDNSFVYKLIKVVQSTEVTKPLTYCKNHHERLCQTPLWACGPVKNKLCKEWPSQHVAFGATEKNRLQPGYKSMYLQSSQFLKLDPLYDFKTREIVTKKWILLTSCR
jgi:hypothetical protein